MAEDEKKKKKRKAWLTKLRESIRENIMKGESKGTTLLTQAKQIKKLGL